MQPLDIVVDGVGVLDAGNQRSLALHSAVSRRRIARYSFAWSPAQFIGKSIHEAGDPGVERIQT